MTTSWAPTAFIFSNRPLWLRDGAPSLRRAGYLLVTTRTRQPGWSGLLGWKPIGVAVAAGAAVLAVGLWNAPGTVPDGQTGGVLRYLDTGGRSVMVVEAQDVTIIWLMEGGVGSDGA